MRKTDLNILFIGDSIINGEFIDPSERFTSLIKKSLLSTVGLNRCINFGALCENGWTTRLALSDEGWSTAMRFCPEIAVIQFGLNDCSRWITDKGIRRVNRKSFKYNLMEMIQRLRSVGCKKIFLLTPHTVQRKTEKYYSDLREYISVIREVARHPDVALIDMNIKIFLREYLLPDGVHLNRAGHQRYAQIILKAFGDLS